ncbi:MAG: dihydrodipicolinate synthase family protein [Oscillospiraceae bacterium]|nr:dihydrodipicolinate synthase family protein [Oscillospiraceae bacterium]
MKKTIPDGVYPTMVTPFTEDNKIDYNAVEALIGWYAEKGVDGIFAICQSSEIFFLSFEERLELLRFVMKHTPKNISVVASGHVADDLSQQIEEAKAFVQEGIDAYVFISNRFAGEDESDSIFLKNMEKAVGEIGDISFGIYECPYPYKRIMTPSVLKELASTGRFTFLKDTCCDPQMINEKLSAVEGMGLKIYNANSAILLETLKMGCAGFSGVMANFHPEIYSWLCKNYDKEPEKAKQVQAFLGFASLAECQMYPVNAKYYLSLEGVPMGYACRSKDASGFTLSRRMEIEQMRDITIAFKESMGIE